MRKSLILGQLAVVCLLVAASAFGQGGTNSGAIGGEVDDSSGAKISGAKVEVASPAMIERVRDTVTGDDGLFKIVNLPPGVYTVTATQDGFSTVRRENIEITTGFTATINFALTPGSVQQTVTVTTEAPVLDTQDSVVQKILSNTVFESLPIGKSQANLPSLIPGAVAGATNQDVGGLKGELSGTFRIHGSGTGDYQLLRDGMPFDTGYSPSGNQNTSNNPTATQEMQFETAGYSAEDWYLGGHVNIIPRNGGNDIHGSVQADYGNKALQGTNLSPAISALGVPTPSSIRSLYEIAGGFGGPIKKDKLWFYVEARHWVSSSFQSGSLYFYNLNEFAPFPNNLYYGANPAQQAYDFNTYLDAGVRLTWQASPRNKFTENWINQSNCNCFYNIPTSNTAPDALTSHASKPSWQEQATWTFPANNKLLLWAGLSALTNTSDALPPGWEGGGGQTSPLAIPVTDTSASNFVYGTTGTGEGATGVIDSAPLNSYDFYENFTASYVTGPHALKFGYTERQMFNSNSRTFPNLGGVNGYPNGVGLQVACMPIDTPVGSIDPANGLPTVAYHTLNATTGVPSANLFPAPAGPGAGQVALATINSLACPTAKITNTSVVVQQALLPSVLQQFLSPYQWELKVEGHSAFGQDQWRVKRLTLNLGVRFDSFIASDPAQTTPANPQYGLLAKSFPAANGVINWKDLDPRIGAAYDLFGNGKTAIKASIARGVVGEYSSGLSTLTNPIQQLASGTNRNFTDLNSNFLPDLSGSGFSSATAFGGAGCVPATGVGCEVAAAKTPQFFSQTNLASVTYGSDVTQGWQTRPSELQVAASVQQEVTRGIALSFGFYRNWLGNQMVARNAIPASASNYDQYCVNVPAVPNSTFFPAGNFGGTPMCNLYDPVNTVANPQAANSQSYVVEKASIFGGVSDIYTGIDVIANVRFHGLILQGGMNAGHEVTNYCKQINSPQDLTYSTNPTPTTATIIEFPNNNFTTVNDSAPCFIDPPWSQSLQFKMAVVYTLPWQKIKLSANEQNLPSIPMQGSYTYAAANITFPCAATSTCNDATNHGGVPKLNGITTGKIEVLAPQTIFPYGRNNQLDFRVAKDFTIHERWKIEPTVDFYNILNANPILNTLTGYNTTTPGTSGAWRNVSALLPARMVKFGVHVDF